MHLPHSCSVLSRLCFGFRQEAARATSNFWVTVWANVQAQVTGMGVLIFHDVLKFNCKKFQACTFGAE